MDQPNRDSINFDDILKIVSTGTQYEINLLGREKCGNLSLQQRRDIFNACLFRGNVVINYTTISHIIICACTIINGAYESVRIAKAIKTNVPVNSSILFNVENWSKDACNWIIVEIGITNIHVCNQIRPVLIQQCKFDRGMRVAEIIVKLIQTKQQKNINNAPIVFAGNLQYWGASAYNSVHDAVNLHKSVSALNFDALRPILEQCVLSPKM